jgi:H(+)-transporting ATP synthase subunit D
LGKGGQQIQSCRKAYLSAIQLLVQLANLQTAFMTLDTALKVTNRRVNALENVVKPKIENTISYIKVGSWIKGGRPSCLWWSQLRRALVCRCRVA